MHKVSRALKSLAVREVLHAMRGQKVSHRMLVLQRSRESRCDAKLMRRRRYGNRRSVLGAFNAHAGNHEIDGGPSDLGLIDVETVHFAMSQASEPSPGGELGFDGEGDEDAH